MMVAKEKERPVQRTERVLRRRRSGLFLGVGIFLVRSAEQVIGTDIVEICQLDNDIHRIIQYTDLVLRVGVLADAKIFTDLFLRIAVVDSKAANVFKFHDFVAHSIT